MFVLERKKYNTTNLRSNKDYASQQNTEKRYIVHPPNRPQIKKSKSSCRTTHYIKPHKFRSYLHNNVWRIRKSAFILLRLLSQA